MVRFWGWSPHDVFDMTAGEFLYWMRETLRIAKEA
jgi:hypothetical protein